MMSQQEIDQCQQMLQQYRVNELHLLLGHFKAPKLGKKHELLQRCYSFLENPRYQREFAQEIRKVNSNTQRYTAYPQTYPARQPNGPNYGGTVSWSHSAVQMNSFRPPDDRQLQSMLIGTNSSYQMNGIPNGFASAGGSTYRVKNLRTGKLPFFDVKGVILDLKELPATIAGMQQPSSKMQFEFDVPPTVLSGLVRNETMPLPRKELQLRFFSADSNNIEQFDSFPPNCGVRIDGNPVVLPNIIPTNKPNVEPKRPSRPVNVTTYISPALNKHTITVEWSSDKRFWAVGIYHVERLNSAILFTRLTNDARFMRPLNVTRNTIIQRLNRGEDDGISMDTMKVSLLCPLGRTRMTMPAKGAECTHLQCFDLNLYLMMNEKRPTWKCAICDKISSAYKLIIDQYFLDILQRAESSVSDVELLKDGSWRVVKVEAETLSSDEDGDIVPCKISSSSAAPTRSSSIVVKPSSSTSPALDDDVITLDSDEDEAYTPPPPSTSTIRTNDSTGTPVLSSPQAVASEKSDISIICLDDSDGDCIPASTSPPVISSAGSQSQTTDALQALNMVTSMPTTSEPTLSASTRQQTLMSALAPVMAQNAELMSAVGGSPLQPASSLAVIHQNALFATSSSYGALPPPVPTSQFSWNAAYNGNAGDGTRQTVPKTSERKRKLGEKTDAGIAEENSGKRHK
ncbi:hypothetical protein QR680_009578 [Steinernema hermaphroditum]|uniref:SP-RING-type domain-containing protein n=1 Tax=Steinernema hermaphroditum TaxID=289476 RepID=A0AA39IKV6_9BILA|nr:hypothetical protein QR680_009578 [Steinernema hermaphroditum]